MSTKQPDPIDLHVGSRLRIRRLMLGLSQHGLGNRVGLTFQQIQKYEKGVNRIGAGRLFQLGRAMGVDVQFFYDEFDEGGDVTAPKQDRIMDMLASNDGMQLCRHYADISDEHVKRSVLELIKTLSDGRSTSLSTTDQS